MKSLFIINRLVFVVGVAVGFVLSFNLHGQSSKTEGSDFSVQLITNQDKFSNGETVFVKAYFLDRERKRVQGKHLVCVFLVDYNGDVQQSIRFNLLGGIGFNQMAFSDSLPVGIYRLIAYVAPIEAGSFGYGVVKRITIVNENTLDYKGHPSSLDSIRLDWQPVKLSVANARVERKAKVAVDVTIYDSQNDPVAAEFSISVRNKAFQDHHESFDILDGTIVGSGDQFFQVKTNSNSSLETSVLKKLSEVTAFQKNGKVLNAETGEPVPDNTQVLFYLQRSEWNHQTFTLNGRVRLNLPHFTGADELFYLGETERGKIIPIQVEWDKEQLPNFGAAQVVKETANKDSYATFVKKKKIIDKSYNAFSLSGAGSDSTVEKNDFDLVEPDQVYRPDKFIPFKTMSEMILEVIPGVYHRKAGKNEIVRITLPDPMTATADPVFFIDGRATTDTKLFLSLNPSDLEYIGIVKDPKKLQPLKLLGKNGIVIVKSKPGKRVKPVDVGGEKLAGLNPYHAFSDNARADLPSFRSTLYWNPSMTTDKEGRATFEFNATDDVGEMIIELRGVTLKGQALLYRLPIHVQ